MRKVAFLVGIPHWQCTCRNGCADKHIETHGIILADSIEEVARLLKGTIAEDNGTDGYYVAIPRESFTLDEEGSDLLPAGVMCDLKIGDIFFCMCEEEKELIVKVKPLPFLEAAEANQGKSPDTKEISCAA